MNISFFGLIVHFLQNLKKRPLDGPLIESSSDLHQHFEQNDGTLYSENDVIAAKFDNLYSERHIVPRRLCFGDNRLSGCFTNPVFHQDSGECLKHILTYLYVLWKKDYTVQAFLVDEGGILFKFFELLLRKYLELLEDEVPIGLTQKSCLDDFQESKNVADFLSDLLEIIETDDEDEDTRTLLISIFDSIMMKYHGAILILQCANFQKRNIDNVTHDPEDLRKSIDGSFLRSVHSSTVFPDDDSFEGFPIHLGIWTSYHIFQILLAKESVRHLNEGEHRSVKNRITLFLRKHFADSDHLNSVEKLFFE